MVLPSVNRTTFGGRAIKTVVVAVTYLARGVPIWEMRGAIIILLKSGDLFVAPLMELTREIWKTVGHIHVIARFGFLAAQDDPRLPSKKRKLRRVLAWLGPIWEMIYFRGSERQDGCLDWSSGGSE